MDDNEEEEDRAESEAVGELKNAPIEKQPIPLKVFVSLEKKNGSDSE